MLIFNLPKTILAAGLFSFLFVDILIAAERGPDDSALVSWGFMITGLLGGLTLFLYGMEKMSDGMKKSAGNKMRSILAALTNNRVIGLVVGAIVTMVIQSSSATTVMLVSFVQADLMTFAQSLGVILGADIGTTITAQLIAFKLTDYALLFIAADFSDEGKEELMIYHVKVCKQISRLKEAFAENNMETTERIMKKESKYLNLESRYRLKHLERLHQKRKESMETHEIHMELMDIFKQINVYTANIAKTYLNTMGREVLTE